MTSLLQKFLGGIFNPHADADAKETPDRAPESNYVQPVDEYSDQPALEPPSTGYKTIIPGTGSGYGELKEYAEIVVLYAKEKLPPSLPYEEEKLPLPTYHVQEKLPPSQEGMGKTFENEKYVANKEEVAQVGHDLERTKLHEGKLQEQLLNDEIVGKQHYDHNAQHEAEGKQHHDHHHKGKHHTGPIQKIRSKVKESFQRVKNKMKDEDSISTTSSEDEGGHIANGGQRVEGDHHS